MSYSITVRLEVASRSQAASELTRTVEQAGGLVTALDLRPIGAKAPRGCDVRRA